MVRKEDVGPHPGPERDLAGPRERRPQFLFDICPQFSSLFLADRTCLRLLLTSLDYLENLKY